MNYFTPAPECLSFEILDLPPFMRGRYSDKKLVFTTDYVLKLIKWAELEYLDTKAYLLSKANKQAYFTLVSIPPSQAMAYLISGTDEFGKLIKNMDDKTWMSYPDPLRKFLAKCYKIYSESLKK